MSSETTVRINGLGKTYRIARTQQHTMLRDALLSSVTAPFRKRIFDVFHALHDVSLEVRCGEVLGVIGRNGAGKSTLLKILSRITEPTSGQVDLYGRVGSLLEVGTGFHPELTGRENIYLNGAILGMNKREIARRFDEIVEFAEVPQFLDTPVKRYSSGMYVRLAFAVAAHLNPEILLVDEVLAVGDAGFQKKCLGKMEDVTREDGRTVLFVSHNMAAISNLCHRCLVLDGGATEFLGPTHEAVEHYTSLALGGPQDPTEQTVLQRPTWARPLITAVRVLDASGAGRSWVTLGTGIRIEVTFDVLDGEPLSSPGMGLVIRHTTLGVVAGVNTRMTGSEWSFGRLRRGTISCTLESVPLLQGNYLVDVWLADGVTDIDNVNGGASFRVEPSDLYGSGKAPDAKLGLIYLSPNWDLTTDD